MLYIKFTKVDGDVLTSFDEIFVENLSVVDLLPLEKFVIKLLVDNLNLSEVEAKGRFLDFIKAREKNTNYKFLEEDGVPNIYFTVKQVPEFSTFGKLSEGSVEEVVGEYIPARLMEG